MKTYALSVLLGASLFVTHQDVSAQSLAIQEYTSRMPVTNTTINYTLSPAQIGQIGVAFVYVNESGSNIITQGIRRHELVSGSCYSEFCDCWGCHSWYEDSTYSVVLAPGDTCEFSSDYTWDGTPGVSVIRFTFFDIENISDSVFVELVYNGLQNTTGIADNRLPEAHISEAQPNPATDLVRFGYTLPSGTQGQLSITDASGREVSVLALDADSGFALVDASVLSPGIYFVRASGEGIKSEIRRMMIAR